MTAIIRTHVDLQLEANRKSKHEKGITRLRLNKRNPASIVLEIGGGDDSGKQINSDMTKWA